MPHPLSNHHTRLALKIKHPPQIMKDLVPALLLALLLLLLLCVAHEDDDDAHQDGHHVREEQDCRIVGAQQQRNSEVPLPA